MKLAAALTIVVLGLVVTAARAPSPQQKSPGAGAVIVLETVKGVIEIETYPEDAPKTVEVVLGLIKKNFYNGLRFHRAEPKFLVQVGDPQSRNPQTVDWWGRQGSGKPIGVSEITKKRRNIRGAVGMAYSGSDPKMAESQFYILRRNDPTLDARYAVFGAVIKGMDVVDKLDKGDMLKRASVKE